MLRLKSSIAATAGIVGAIVTAAIVPIGKAVFKAIFDVEVQDAWKDNAHPSLGVIWTYAVEALQWLNTFWGGAIFVLVIVFCVEVTSARRKLNAAQRDAAAVELSREQLIRLGQRCERTKTNILREHTRAVQARAETTARRGFGGHADMGFAIWTAQQADTATLANEFASEALAALGQLTDVGITVPDFTARDPCPSFKQAIEHVISFYLVDIATFLGVVAIPLLDGDLRTAQSAARRWAAGPAELITDEAHSLKALPG